MSNAKKIVAGAGGVVRNTAGDYLVLGHRNGNWVFPKGHIEPGETHLQAAVREVEEESGVVAVCPDPAITFQTKYVNAQGDARCITWFPLTCATDKVLLREASFPRGGFYPFDQALEKLTYADDRALLVKMHQAAGESQKTG